MRVVVGAKPVRTFHAYFHNLCRSAANVEGRLRLLHVFDTSEWGWIGAAVRPTATTKGLHVMRVTCLMCARYCRAHRIEIGPWEGERKSRRTKQDTGGGHSSMQDTIDPTGGMLQDCPRKEDNQFRPGLRTQIGQKDPRPSV